MKQTYYSLGSRYQEDVKNFNDWFHSEMEAIKSDGRLMASVSYIMRKLRSTPGLIDTVEFLNDIYDKMEMSVNHINIMRLTPGAVTGVWTEKIRPAPMTSSDYFYDPDLPDRKSLLIIPLSNTADLLKIHWLSWNDSNAITGPKIVPSAGMVFEETTVFGNDSFLVDSTRKCVFDNKDNPGYAYFLKVGLEDNPTFEQVKSKLETLD